MKFFDSYDPRLFFGTALGCAGTLISGLWLIVNSNYSVGELFASALAIGCLSAFITYLAISAWNERNEILSNYTMFSGYYAMTVERDEQSLWCRHPKLVLTIFAYVAITLAITFGMAHTRQPFEQAVFLTLTGGIGWTLLFGFVLWILPPIEV